VSKEMIKLHKTPSISLEEKTLLTTEESIFVNGVCTAE
tara:strand:- start:536 stop:649 length:114 start_codon:yes stop_codon:yes gene_type:complete